jgi:hypothetical protein
VSGRDRKVIALVVVVAAVVAGWLMVIQPKRSEASKLGSQVNSVESQVNSARSTVAQDEAARASFSASYAEIARLGEAVPADDDVPSLLYQLQNAASATHVDFRSLVLNAQTAATTTAAAPASASPKTGSSSSSSSSSTSTGSSATAIAPISASVLPPGAAVGPAGFPTENFTLTFQGNFLHLSNFLKRVERFVKVDNDNVSVSGRLMTLNAITLGAGPGGFPTMDAEVSATAYLVPAAQGLLGGASPTGPSASTSSVSGTPSSSSSVTPAATVTP